MLNVGGARVPLCPSGLGSVTRGSSSPQAARGGNDDEQMRSIQGSKRAQPKAIVPLKRRAEQDV